MPPNPPSNPDGSPPCFVAPAQLYDGKQFTLLQKGEVYLKPSPKGFVSSPPADPNRPLTSGR